MGVFILVLVIVFIVLGYFFFKTQEFSDLFTFFYISGVKKSLLTLRNNTTGSIRKKAGSYSRQRQI